MKREYSKYSFNYNLNTPYFILYLIRIPINLPLIDRFADLYSDFLINLQFFLNRIVSFIIFQITHKVNFIIISK